jgi:hypothetical protein
MDWDRVPEVTADAGWTELPGNGWGAVIAAAAGEGRVGRRPAPRSAFTTRVIVRAGRRVQAWTEPRSEHDQATIDEDVDEFLAAADLPPRPSGFVWSLRHPEGWDVAQDPVELISARIVRTDAVLPADVLREARSAVEQVLADPQQRSRTDA